MVIVIGIVAVAGVPRADVAGEQARVDQAAGGLRSVFLAERLWWLEHGEYGGSLAALADAHFLDQGMVTVQEPFAFTIQAADADSFVAEATRAGSLNWTGSLSIDQAGTVDGEVVSEGGRHVAPVGG